ncbi:MAG TPA: ParB/RepB/Spo0J family partition protein [Candidatus Binataceae bacterium]|jgi:ParB family chromosome partitioning protein|nr:ParB/RepB/Spo0J family partition protein [Candidatus Binataceae bacterium]
MIRRPLGRGLDALIESTGTPAPAAPASAPRPGDGALLSVALDRVAPSPLQPRRHFDPERLEELAQAIRSQGVIEPLVVRPIPPGADGASDDRAPRYELIAGERRLRAARMAGLDSVPVIVRELDDHAALEMSLVENLVRDELNAVEEAHAFRRLNQEFRLSHEEIAARIGKSRPYVTNQMRLLELAPAVQEMIERGELTPGQARPLLGLPAPSQAAAARRIAEGRISARGAEQLAGAARSPRNGSSARRAAGVDPNIAALAEAMQRALKRKVRIVLARGRTPGRIELEYYDIDDLSTLAVMLARSAHGASAASSS